MNEVCVCNHRWHQHTRSKNGAEPCRYFGCGCSNFEEAEDPTRPDGTPIFPRRKLTCNERLQMAADSGFDTWDDYRGEK